MAKGQKRSNREVRKPKASTPKKANASAPSIKSPWTVREDPEDSTSLEKTMTATSRTIRQRV